MIGDIRMNIEKERARTANPGPLPEIHKHILSGGVHERHWG